MENSITTFTRTRMESSSGEIAERPNNVVFSGQMEATEEKSKKRNRHNLSKASLFWDRRDTVHLCKVNEFQFFFSKREGGKITAFILFTFFSFSLKVLKLIWISPNSFLGKTWVNKYYWFCSVDTRPLSRYETSNFKKVYCKGICTSKSYSHIFKCAHRCLSAYLNYVDPLR